MQTYIIGRSFYPGVEIPLMVYMNLEKLTDIPLHTAFRIVIIEEGTGVIRTNDKKLIIHAPYIFILNEEETIHMEGLNDMKLHILFFQPRILNIKYEFSFIRQFSRENVTDPFVQDLYLFNPFLIRDGNQVNQYRLTNSMLRKLINLMEGIKNELEGQENCYWICRGRAYLLEILCYLSKFPLIEGPIMEKVLDTGEADIMEKMLLFVHTRYAEKITLKTLVEHFHINRTTVNKLFKKNTGESVISYIIQLRIEASSLMLRDTGLPINEIAYRVGFEDIANFSRIFKKMMCCSPSQYRKNNSWLV